ncbi:MAG: molybdopterin molybdotransferase MoeA [Verrucomicrobiae bacterium]|nr:molybdopterin molybdotransferase MoeA [Verrucomicrobiae bacterium]
MLTVQEAQSHILQSLVPLANETIALTEAENRVLAMSISADEDFPPFARSAVDGYAVIAEEVPGAFTISEIIHAGQSPKHPLISGNCARIFTGAPLPQGANGVVMQEEVQTEADRVKISQAYPKMNIRQKGEDYKKGDCLLKKGTPLHAAQLAIAASIGQTHLSVFRQPRIAILSTGDELVSPDATPAPYQIRDTNTLLLKNLIPKSGGKLLSSHLLPDDYSQLQTHLQKALTEKVDLILFSGGASVGEKDFTKKLLQENGFQVHFDQINIRPGKPLIFATRNNIAAFGIPGNPVSLLVCFYLFIQIAIQKMQGVEAKIHFLHSPLGKDFDYSPNLRETYWPARCETKKQETELFPLAWKGSGHIASFAYADALIQIPSGSGPFTKGKPLFWLPL